MAIQTKNHTELNTARLKYFGRSQRGLYFCKISLDLTTVVVTFSWKNESEDRNDDRKTSQ